MGSQRVGQDLETERQQEVVAKWLPMFLSSKESTCSAGDTGDVGLISMSQKYPGIGSGNPLQYSCLENPMNSMKSKMIGY